jgi:PAS domain S-box-containing protein
MDDFSPTFYATLLDNLYDGVYFVDRERRITFWNKAAERITGFTKAEVVGKRCADNLLRHVDNRGNSLCEGACPLSYTLNDSQPRSASVFLHHKDGHRLPVAIRVAPITDHQQKIVGAVEIFRDNSATSRPWSISRNWKTWLTWMRLPRSPTAPTWKILSSANSMNFGAWAGLSG